MTIHNETIEQFERQISKLLKNYERYKQENILLRQEREELQQKHQNVIETIESLITRLQAFEYDSDN